MIQLYLPPHCWQAEIPALFRERRRGSAELRRFGSADAAELVANHVRPWPTESSAAVLRPFDQRLVVEFSESLGADAGERLLDELAPQPDQLVVALTLGVGRSAGRWTGLVSDQGMRRTLDAFRFVGPKMRTFPDLPVAKDGDDDPRHDRWSRMRGAVGERVLEQVRRSRVALIGASRNGSFAAFALAMLGVSRLVICDPDRDELHQLPATLGATLDGVGDWKVHNRAADLRRIRPEMIVDAFPCEFPNRRMLAALQDVDLICTATDADLPRLAAARWANDHCRPHLDIGSGVFFAGPSGRSSTAEDSQAERRMGLDVQLALPGQACVACLAGLREDATARSLLASPPGTLPPGPDRPWHAGRAGSLPTINAVAVNLALQMWLDLLAGTLPSSCWLRMEWTPDGIPNLTHRFQPAAICRVCRGV